MREIPKKNYVYLVLLTIVTIFIALVFFNIYRNYAKKGESFISKNLTTINGKSLDSILIDNSILFIYVDDVYNTKDNELQEKLFNSIKENELIKYFVFLDNSDIDNQKYMSKKYNINIKNNKMLLLFEDNHLILKKDINNDFEKNINNMITSIEGSND